MSHLPCTMAPRQPGARQAAQVPADGQQSKAVVTSDYKEACSGETQVDVSHRSGSRLRPRGWGRNRRPFGGRRFHRGMR